MPGAMPADVAERLSDVRALPITAADLDAAREEMIEKLLAGKQVGSMTFADILDAELDSRTRSTVGEVAAHLLAIIDFARTEHEHGARRAGVEAWARGMVERWVDTHPEKIRERAEEMVADEDADA